MIWSITSFFFQAEDGIRDLVRSRGLGDVYKRQSGHHVRWQWQEQLRAPGFARSGANAPGARARLVPVSYTHLTLPTIYSV